MGWVGVVTLVGTACFVLYRHAPVSWSSPYPPQPRSTSPEQNSYAILDDAPKPESNPLEGRENENEKEEESQTTPKASASGAPSLEVPTLHLDNKQSSIPKPQDQPQTLYQQPPQNGSTKPPPTASRNSLMPPPTGALPRQQPNASNSSLMPPPPPGRRAQNQQPQSAASLTAGRYPPRPNTNGSLHPPPSAAASLRGPPARRPLNNSLSPIALNVKPSSSSKRAVLEPGFSPLDWAALTSNPNHKLRGAGLPPNLIRVTPSMLKAQNGRKGRDAWTSYQGKVYNITPYLPFHPGGKGELLRGVGKDSAQLFFEVHPWVNWDAILGECLVGILVSENDESNENKLDAMD
ncbi:hypothetical protein EYZ11_001610 [Aspergillus tanneri]|uniref:Cytochrome b5 reductase 4 n=1 Tax=Aspergillus tanneri TaxID=1220188 RepID=A0A4S3JTW5_9EURO|nr:Cytochrome b5 reductase 4 [Aspergillus tanneri]KAA8647379.1 Cytochrome b5 reductase 4 [Aspergillus tanneri]THC98897.1 hypothetical protein EYZ11_001610 [Aspergillus tanneri]